MFRSSRRWMANRSRLAMLAGVIGMAALALGTTASLGGFSASITNTGDKVATGNLIMQEAVTPIGGSTTTCLSTAAGAAITTNANTCAANKFGALTNAVPGATSSSNVVITNQGSVAASTFTMGTAPCVATPTIPPGPPAATNVGSDTAGFCGKVDVTIEDDTGTATCIYPAGPGVCPTPSASNTLTTLATAYGTTPLSLTAPIAAGGARTYKVTVMIDTTANNTDQAMAATEPITFNFAA